MTLGHDSSPLMNHKHADASLPQIIKADVLVEEERLTLQRIKLGGRSETALLGNRSCAEVCSSNQLGSRGIQPKVVLGAAAVVDVT